MDKKAVIEIVKLYAILLKKYLVFDKIYLFGSYAKDNQNANSDIDVAIVVDEYKGDFFSINPLLWKIRRQIDDRIEPILIERKHDDSDFLSEIQKYGIEIQ